VRLPQGTPVHEPGDGLAQGGGHVHHALLVLRKEADRRLRKRGAFERFTEDHSLGQEGAGIRIELGPELLPLAFPQVQQGRELDALPVGEVLQVPGLGLPCLGEEVDLALDRPCPDMGYPLGHRSCLLELLQFDGGVRPGDAERFADAVLAYLERGIEIVHML